MASSDAPGPERAPCVLVLGIGNLLMGDEGVGVHAVQALEHVPLPPGVDVLDGGTGGFQLLAPFREYPCVILIDATLDDQPPGTVTVLQPRFVADYPRALAAHDIGLRELIEAAALLGTLPRVHLITVSIAQVDAATTALSIPVRKSIPAVLNAVHALLQQEGFAPTATARAADHR